MHWVRILVVSAVIAFSAPEVFALPSYISNGGAPHSFQHSPTVSMESAVINISVSKDLIKGDCSFKLVNAGPKCTFNMGLPDQVWAAPINKPAQQPTGKYLSYELFVDGVKANAKLVKADREDMYYNYWHENAISFEANGTRTIRHVYSTRPGVQSNVGGAVKALGYMFNTAGSWRGNINHAFINIKFEKDAVPEPLSIVSIQSLPDQEWGEFDWVHATPGTLLYYSSKAPVVKRSSISFEFRDWEPSQKDDIFVQYARMNESDARKYEDMLDKADESVHSK